MLNPLVGLGRSATGRYAAAILATAACSLIPLLVHPELDDARLPFVALIPAIAFSAWLGGFGTGMVSTLLAVVVAAVVWAQPGLSLHNISAHDMLALSLLACMGVLLSVLDGFIHRALADARRSATRAEHEAAERGQAERALQARMRQQAAVADLGQRALADVPVRQLMDDAVAAMRYTLAVDCTKIVELQPGGRTLLLRAGDGWNAGVVGHATVGVGSASQAGYTLAIGSDEPLIVHDLRTETRFSTPALLRDHGVLSGMSVVIRGPHRPYGVLGVHCRSPRVFTRDDANFVQAVANVLASAIAREHVVSERDASLAAAQQANRLKDEFLATLSHEIRTPLNAILGWASLVHSGKVSGSRRTQGLEAILRNAQAQAQIVSDLLDVSRIITGKLALNLEDVDVGLVVDGVVESLQPAAYAKHIRLSLAGNRRATLAADRVRLQQIVWNLASNAIKFTPAGGAVDIEAGVEGSTFELVVRDSGAGISPDFLPHVFDRFSQADSSTTRVHGGLGLGLAIVRHLVELHGGTVEAASDGEGRGATFTVRLPVTKPLAPRPPTAPSPDDEEASEPARASLLDELHVLVVDDDRDGREILTLMLEQAGATVTCAASAGEALAQFRVRTPDLIVSDIAMPGVDGCTLMRDIRALPEEQGGRVNAVAVTACASATDRERALAAGYDMYFVKPILNSEFVAALAVLTGRGQVA